MKVSMGITNAAVLPEPKTLCQVEQQQLTRGYLTSLSDANNIAVLQTNWNSLPLNGRWFLVADLIDDSEDLWRDRGLVPGPQRLGDRATCPRIRERKGREV